MSREVGIKSVLEKHEWFWRRSVSEIRSTSMERQTKYVAMSEDSSRSTNESAHTPGRLTSIGTRVHIPYIRKTWLFRLVCAPPILQKAIHHFIPLGKLG